MPVNQAERDKLPEKDFAGPHQSFPIVRGKPETVRAAWDLAGHAADPEKVRARIVEIAKRMGLESHLPEDARHAHGIKAAIGPEDMVVFFGGDVKALGGGKVGGVVAPFATPETADRQGEYFHAGTDFGLDVATKARVVYHHGFTRELGPRKLGVADLSVAGDGLHGVVALDMADPDCKALYDDAAAGRMFWSSGSAERLVTRQAVKGALRIDSWPIIEVSLTRNPVDRRARAVAVKALLDVKGEALGPYAGRHAARAAINTLHEHAASRLMDHMGDATKSRPERLGACRAVMREHSDKAVKAIDALMDDDAGMIDDSSLKAIIDGAVAGPSLLDRTDQLVADCEVVVGLYREAVKARAVEGRYLSRAKRDALKALHESIAGLLAADPERAAGKRAAALARALSHLHG